jgi:hypothetical protein
VLPEIWRYVSSSAPGPDPPKPGIPGQPEAG